MHGIQTKTLLIDHLGVKQHLKSFIMLSASNYALKYSAFLNIMLFLHKGL